MSKPPLAVPKQTPENTFGDHVSPSVQARKSRLLTLTLCGAGLDPDTRRTGDIRLRGWGFTAEKVSSAMADTDGFIIKNPGGTLPNEPMQLTQWAQAKRAGLHWLTDTFVREWSPVVKAYRDSGREPIVYLGSFQGDKLWHSVPAGQRSQLFIESFGDFADSGFTFALDWFHNLDLRPEIKVEALATLKRIRTYSRRTRIYVEPFPCPTDQWATDLSISTTISNANASFRWDQSYRNDVLPNYAGEVVVMLDDDLGRGWQNPAWIIEDLRKCAARGWSAAVPFDTGIEWKAMREALKGVAK